MCSGVFTQYQQFGEHSQTWHVIRQGFLKYALCRSIVHFPGGWIFRSLESTVISPNRHSFTSPYTFSTWFPTLRE